MKKIATTLVVRLLAPLPIDLACLIAAVLPPPFLAGALHSARQLIGMALETRPAGMSDLQKVETMVGAL
jgi:hypothetical protein